MLQLDTSPLAATLTELRPALLSAASAGAGLSTLARALTIRLGVEAERLEAEAALRALMNPHGPDVLAEWLGRAPRLGEAALPLSWEQADALLSSEPSDLDVLLLGTLYQESLHPDRRHQLGAHFTGPAEIDLVLGPTLIQPLEDALNEAADLGDLEGVRRRLGAARVLDPACGSGNFLVQALRELHRLERLAQERQAALGGSPEQCGVSPSQLFGLDTSPVAAELARLGLVLTQLREYGAGPEPTFVLVDGAIRCDDALFCDWPQADAIVGNPPFQGKNKAQRELGPAYLQRLRRRYPGVPGTADLCTYWFHRAHDELGEGGRAGLVGTNSIRHTGSRRGGLDHVVSEGGVITDAVGSLSWPGAAGVHVSVVNWQKGGTPPQTRRLREGDQVLELDHIGPDLSSRPRGFDLTQAKPLRANKRPKVVYQGQSPGHAAFLIPRPEAEELLHQDPDFAQVLRPFLDTDDILDQPGGRASRFVIDFQSRSLDEARTYQPLLDRIERAVLPVRQRKASEEQLRNEEARRKGGKAGGAHHAGFLKRWWLLSWRRAELISRVSSLPRYLVTGRVSARPYWAFVDPAIRPMDLLYCFAAADDYSFGVLHSTVFEGWRVARGGSLAGTTRTTPTSGFASFPWPQRPRAEHVEAVGRAAARFQLVRQEAAERLGTLRRAYALLEATGSSPLQQAHAALDKAVRLAYGMPTRVDSLEFLLRLNVELNSAEEAGRPISPPFLPSEHTALLDALTGDAAIKP